MRRIQGVVFDYGSTLICFHSEFEKVRPSAHRAMVDALHAEDIPVDAESFPRMFHADLAENETRRDREHREIPTIEILAGAMRRAGWPDAPRAALARVMRRYYAEYERHWHLFPETHAVLRELRGRGLRLAMLTNAADADNIHHMLEQHALAEFFHPLVISAVAGYRKPEPRLFHGILDIWKVPAQSVVMVGDQLGMDILGAHGAGMRSSWLRTEADAPSNRIHLGKIFPDAEADTVAGVPAILKAWEEEAG
jgi:HAD superfamily hydrolase (TIGR01662 family)